MKCTCPRIRARAIIAQERFGVYVVRTKLKTDLLSNSPIPPNPLTPQEYSRPRKDPINFGDSCDRNSSSERSSARSANAGSKLLSLPSRE
jgi:hypothetical protein